MLFKKRILKYLNQRIEAVQTCLSWHLEEEDRNRLKIQKGVLLSIKDWIMKN